MNKSDVDLTLVTRFSSYRVSRSPNGNVATGGRRRVPKGGQELVSSTSTGCPYSNFYISFPSIDALSGDGECPLWGAIYESFSTSRDCVCDTLLLFAYVCTRRRRRVTNERNEDETHFFVCTTPGTRRSLRALASQSYAPDHRAVVRAVLVDGAQKTIHGLL